MADNIFGQRFIERENGKTGPAWWALDGAYVCKAPFTPLEAIQTANLDYEIGCYPALVDLGGVMTSFGQVAIVREPTADDNQYRVFGSAKEGYTLLQNREIAEVLEPLSKVWPTETVGALGKGETVFFTFNAGETAVRGDPVQQYFLVDDTRDGGTALSISFTPVRVVCQNTLSAGKAAAITDAKLRHTESIRETLEWRVELLEQMAKVQNEVMDSFEMMAHAVLNQVQIDSMLEVAYPYPRKPKKVVMAEKLGDDEVQKYAGLMDAITDAEREFSRSKDRADERRAVVRELLGSFNDANPKLANTAWGAYNAVVEMEDYRKKQSSEEPLVSLLFGERARVKQRAYASGWDFTQQMAEVGELVSVERT